MLLCDFGENLPVISYFDGKSVTHQQKTSHFFKSFILKYSAKYPNIIPIISIDEEYSQASWKQLALIIRGETGDALQEA